MILVSVNIINFYTQNDSIYSNFKSGEK